MRCPGCGTDVVDEAGFCHKCGRRLEALDQQSPSAEPTDDGSKAEDTPPEEPSPPESAPEEKAPAKPDETPAERFKQSATARQDAADEPEEQLWKGRYCSKAMIGAWVFSAMISVALLLIWIWWWPGGWVWLGLVVAILLLGIYQYGVLKYRQWSIQYELTTQRFILHKGILRRVTDRIEIIDIDDVTCEQSLLERLVGAGTIRIESSDKTDPKIDLLGIENAKDVAAQIDDVRRTERHRRGLHIIDRP